jgi:hypothetical protein
MVHPNDDVTEWAMLEEEKTSLKERRRFLRLIRRRYPKRASWSGALSGSDGGRDRLA